MDLSVNELIGLVIAAVLGGAIGLEREIGGKPAGLRTNILVCFGAAAFTIMAKRFSGTGAVEPRMIAGVITGVGFLGAGALIQEGKGIHGLTTAASVWLVTSIGIACGAGMYVLAVTVAVIALVVLLGLTPITRAIHRKFGKDKVTEG